MEGLVLTVTATSSSCTTTSSSSYLQTCLKGKNTCLFSLKSQRVRIRALKCPRNFNKFAVFASKENPNFDSLDQMELKFGRLLGEDPKLTLAKIMGRKANPEASYLEIEKSFYKNKGNIVEVKEVPIDGLGKRQSLSSLEGLNLVRPVPKKGFEVKVEDKSNVSETKRPRQPVGKAVGGIKRSVPNVILRKPSKFYEDDVEDKSSRLRIKPNLSLAIRNEQEKDTFSDMTLLRKPEPASVEKNIDMKEEQSGNVSSFTLLEKPQAKDLNTVHDHFDSVEYTDVQPPQEGLVAEGPTGLQPHEESVVDSIEDIAAEKELSSTSLADYDAKLSLEAALHGKPKILCQPVKEISDAPQSSKEQVEFENILVASPLEGHEDADWARAEDLVEKGYKGEVELISCSPRGFVASFGSLIGFLPYRNLAARWKFLAFESWLRRKGLDPSQYRPNLGIIGNFDAANTSPLLNSKPAPYTDIKSESAISPDMKIEDLLRIYDNEKIKFLSSFVGQKLKVNILLANRKSRKLVFSLRPKEKEETAEKKRSLMAKLQVGDVVKCCIKKITYFGIFVEVEGVPALIHQTEVSWDATLDPSLYFKIGQIVDAKVHQLDFSLERIFLSLKEIMPDPLTEALETVIGDRAPLDGRLEAAEATAEWPDVESIIKELQQIEGIQSVSKGRFFLSPGLAPTFQVYMASMFENQYKLLARSENKVQEVMVRTSLGKEELKSAILTCTNRVE